MSFLSSVIAEITGEKPPLNGSIVLQPPKPIMPQARAPGLITNLVNVDGSQKRKAEDVSRPRGDSYERGNGLGGNSTKKLKTEHASSAKAAATISSSVKPGHKVNPEPKLPGLPSPAISSTPKAPPRKGTFAEIMARAKNGTAAPPPVGVIKHKPIERLTDRERRRQRLLAKVSKGKGSEGVSQRGASSDPGPLGERGHEGRERGGSRKTDSNRPTSKKAFAKSSYKGTAASSGSTTTSSTKAKASSYKGTARPSTAHSASSRPRLPSSPTTKSRTRTPTSLKPFSKTKHQRSKPAHSDDDDDDSSNEAASASATEDDDLDSNASSDMEAAAFEVEVEEAAALEKARREDARAARLEADLKRKKEERRRLLATSNR